jgi:hypothetical protein
MKWHYSRCGRLGGQGKACGDAKRMRRDGKFYAGGANGIGGSIRPCNSAQRFVSSISAQKSANFAMLGMSKMADNNAPTKQRTPITAVLANRRATRVGRARWNGSSEPRPLGSGNQ